MFIRLLICSTVSIFSLASSFSLRILSIAFFKLLSLREISSQSSVLSISVLQFIPPKLRFNSFSETPHKSRQKLIWSMANFFSNCKRLILRILSSFFHFFLCSSNLFLQSELLPELLLGIVLLSWCFELFFVPLLLFQVGSVCSP